VPVLTRKRSVRVLLIMAAGFPLLLAGGAAVLSVLIGQSCTPGGVGDTPSRAAMHDIPPRFLTIYERVGAQYRLPWEILAGIGREECDDGRDPDPSCTPQPGATGPGVANCAGASGPMQIGVGGGPCGVAGDEYDLLRRYLPDPSLGPHDPTTAVELAALVLIRDKGAPAGQPIDAYVDYVRAYNGSGPIADAYAARVLADAHAYQGAGTTSVGADCSGAVGTRLVAGTKARILPSGAAAAPADAPAVVQEMLAAGNRINHFPYSYAGGHGAVAQTMNQTTPDPAAFPGAEENGGPGYDCSSATDYVLYGGGVRADPPPGHRARLDHAGEHWRSGRREVGDDLHQRRPRLYRGGGHLPRYGGGDRKPAEPLRRRVRGGAPSGRGRRDSWHAIHLACSRGAGPRSHVATQARDLDEFRAVRRLV
jgi:hypothetical protein